MAVCCNRCFEEIARESGKGAAVWLELCAYASKHGRVIKFREWRIPDSAKTFRMLESKGFIASADGDDAVRLRINGYLTIETEKGPIDTYCIKREEHGHDWK